MNYDDCKNCINNEHDKCESDPEYSRFICTCALCNGTQHWLNLKNIDFNGLTKESFMISMNSMNFHVEHMTDENWETFKKQIGTKKMNFVLSESEQQYYDQMLTDNNVEEIQRIEELIYERAMKYD